MAAPLPPFFSLCSQTQETLESAVPDSTEARKPSMAAAVPSVEPSFTTITLISCSRGDSPRTESRARLVAIRYCSLYAGTITESVVLVRFFPIPSCENGTSADPRIVPVPSTRFVDEVALIASSAIVFHWMTAHGISREILLCRVACWRPRLQAIRLPSGPLTGSHRTQHSSRFRLSSCSENNGSRHPRCRSKVSLAEIR